MDPAPHRRISFSHWAVAFLTATALLGACDGTPTAVDPVGSWGGEGIRLDVAAAGGTLEFDCAVGTIDAPLVLDENGAFVLPGTFTLGHGGPDIEGQEPVPVEATFTGTVAGDRMTLEGRFGAEDTRIGPYSLRKDRDPLLRECQ